MVVVQIVEGRQVGQRGVGTDGLVTVLTPREAIFQIADDIVDGLTLEEAFVRDVPTYGH